MSLILVAMKRDATPDAAKSSMEYLLGNYLIDRLADVLNERYKEEAQKADCPFVEAEIENGNYLISRTKDALTLTIVPKEGKEKEALAAALREVKRAHDFGVNASEFDRAKTEYLSQVEKKYNNREKLPNNGYCQDYVEHFIGNEPIPSIEDLYQLMSQMSPMMPVEAVNEVAKQLLVEGEKNLVVLTLMQDKEGQTYPTRDELKAVTDKVWTEKLEAYVDNTRQEPIMATTPKAGKIVKEEQNSALGCTKLTLSNGATVLMKKTDFNDNEIVMSAYAKGGMSMFDKKDNSNMQMFGEVFRNIFGWNVTRPSALDPKLYDDLYRLYVDDAEGLGVRQFLEQKNPAAYQSMTETMLESARKGYWKPSDVQLAQMKQLNTRMKAQTASDRQALVLEKQGGVATAEEPASVSSAATTIAVVVIVLLLSALVVWMRRRK